MSLSDFCKLTPEDFGWFVRSAASRDEAQSRTEWEAARLVAAVSVMPHLKKGASRDPRKICPLPWDKGGGNKKPRPSLSREEADALFEKRMKDEAERSAAVAVVHAVAEKCP